MKVFEILNETHVGRFPPAFQQMLKDAGTTEYRVFEIIKWWPHEKLVDFVNSLTKFERNPNQPEVDFKSKNLHIDLIVYACRTVWWWGTEDMKVFIKQHNSQMIDTKLQSARNKEWYFKIPTYDYARTMEFDEVEFQYENDKEEHFLPDWVRRTYEAWLKDERSFSTDFSNGEKYRINNTLYRKIGNTGDSWEDSNWKPESKERVEKMYKEGEAIIMPIILVNSKTGDMWLLGGHHRLTYCIRVLKQPAYVWALLIEEKP